MSLFGSFNSVTICGNMTRDVEPRTTPAGKRVANITIAINEGKDETTFVDVTAWEKTVELLERFGGKGKCVLVSGRLRQETWDDKATGEKRSKLVVVANSVSFMGGKEGEHQQRPDRTPARNRGRDTRPAGRPASRSQAGGYETDPDAIGGEEPSFDPRKGGYKGGYAPAEEYGDDEPNY